MEKDKTCEECGRQFHGGPYPNIDAWGDAFHVDANSVDGPLEVSVVFKGKVRAGTLSRLVDVYITLCPACVAVALEVALRAAKAQAAAEGLLDLSPQPCECTGGEECCTGAEEMPDLDFLNAVHHDGPNTTVRRGLKWNGAVRPGDKVRLCDHGKWTGKLAEVVDVRAKKMFSMIRAEDVVDEHDLDCRDLAGLEVAMRRAYPEFETTDTCTLLSYRVLDTEEGS